MGIGWWGGNGKYTFACIKDRITGKLDYSALCPVCHESMQNMGTKWRAPKKNNDKAWRMIAEGNYMWDVRYNRRKEQSKQTGKWRHNGADLRKRPTF